MAFKGTKREAEIELARLVFQNAAGEGVDPSKETVTQFAARWERDWASLNLSPKSLERYGQIFRLYVVPHLARYVYRSCAPPIWRNCMHGWCAAAAMRDAHWQRRS